MTGYAARSDARKRMEEEAAAKAVPIVDATWTPGTVKIGGAITPAVRSTLGDVLVNYLGVWHTVLPFTALSFREVAKP